jgi:hypothetical protein
VLHLALKYVKLVIGVLLVLVGTVLALPFVPGPGIPLIILGLVFLSDHFPWAKRALHWLKEKTRWRTASSERTAQDEAVPTEAGSKQLNYPVSPHQKDKDYQ